MQVSDQARPDICHTCCSLLLLQGSVTMTSNLSLHIHGLIIRVVIAYWKYNIYTATFMIYQGSSPYNACQSLTRPDLTLSHMLQPVVASRFGDKSSVLTLSPFVNMCWLSRQYLFCLACSKDQSNYNTGQADVIFTLFFLSVTLIRFWLSSAKQKIFFWFNKIHPEIAVELTTWLKPVSLLLKSMSSYIINRHWAHLLYFMVILNGHWGRTHPFKFGLGKWH